MYHIDFVDHNGRTARRESYATYDEAIQHFIRYAKKKDRGCRSIILSGPNQKVEKYLRYRHWSPEVFSLYGSVLYDGHYYAIVRLNAHRDEALIEDVDIHSHMDKSWVSLDDLSIKR